MGFMGFINQQTGFLSSYHGIYKPTNITVWDTAPWRLFCDPPQFGEPPAIMDPMDPMGIFDSEAIFLKLCMGHPWPQGVGLGLS